MQRPGAAERDEREARAGRVRARPRRRRSARSISALTTSITAAGSMPPSARSAAFAVELEPAGKPVRQPPEQEVRVGDGRARAAAPVAGRPGSAPALSGPTRSAPPASRQTIEPPPAPTVCRSTVGRRTGSPADARSVDTARRAARDQANVGRGAAHVERDRVVEAPPAGRRAPRRRRPQQARRRATRTDARPPRRRVATPPEERITSGSGSPAPAHAAASARGSGDRRPEIGVDRGRRGALVLAKLRRDLVGRDDVRGGIRRRSSSATARSCEGSRNENSRQTATASASDVRQRAEIERVEHAIRPDALLSRRSSARAARAAPDDRRRAGRDGPGSASAGAGDARSLRWRRTPSARPCARAVRSSRPSCRA